MGTDSVFRTCSVWNTRMWEVEKQVILSVILTPGVFIIEENLFFEMRQHIVWCECSDIGEECCLHFHLIL